MFTLHFRCSIGRCIAEAGERPILSRENQFVGHVIGPARLELVLETTDAISPFINTMNNKRMETISWSMQCIQTLRSKLRTHWCFNWRCTEKAETRNLDHLLHEEMDASRTWAQHLMAPSVLAFRSRVGDLKLDTDYCDELTGCMLSQAQLDGKKKPLGYWSGTPNATDQT